MSLAGVAVWGVGFGVHESVIAAVVATMVGPARRASAYGIFTAGFGVFWFLGSALLGLLYDISIPTLVIVASRPRTRLDSVFLCRRSPRQRLRLGSQGNGRGADPVRSTS